MDHEKLATAIWAAIERSPRDRAAYEDLFALCRSWAEESPAAAHAENKRLLARCAEQVQAQAGRDAEAWYDQWRRCLLFEAPHDFDAFMTYIELDRKPEKRFYAPRRHYLRPMVQGYQDILDGKLKLLTISMPKRTGKLMAHDTPVLTPTGFKKHGELVPGDHVYGLSGVPAKVLVRHPDSYAVYRVKFSNGEELLTSAEHEWLVFDKSRNKYRIMETGEMLQQGLKSKNGRWNFLLPKCDPIAMPDKTLPVAPYSLGAWLGDGTTARPTMTNDHKDLAIIRRMVCDGYPLSNVFVDKNYGTVVSQFTSKLTDDLRSVGMCFRDSCKNKYIPEEYFTASFAQRVALLAGLIDTDGTIDKGNHRVAISTVLPRLRDDIVRLVSTFGVDCRWFATKPKVSTSGIVGRSDVYTITFAPDFPIPTVLPRKQISMTGLARRVSVRAIEALETPVVGNCITVEGGVYRVGHSQLLTHNSQTEINFVNMLSGKFPDRSTLMEGTGDDLVRSFYNGCIEYLQSPNEYLFYDVFPEARLVQTNADTKIINLKSKSRFPTIMCRSIDARQVGLSEATNALIMDDCVEGREEAKNRQRLDDKWEVISGDIMGRAIEGTPMVFTGTRYSLYDPIGRIQEHAQREGWSWRAIEVPALDPITDESNYEYVREGKRVFTTAYFREQRALLSAEQFESEFQQQPFEAKGLLFPEKELNYFFELPVDRDPDTVIAVADPAESGSDATSMPVAKVYGSEVYIVDVVFDDAPPEVTKPECATCLIRNGVGTAVFESNNAGTYFARDVDQLVRARGGSVAIRTKRTISNKQTRIEFASDNIKKNFYFKHPSTYERGSQYWAFMKEVTTYVRTGKVPHDDAPDSLSLLENELRGLVRQAPEVFPRPW